MQINVKISQYAKHAAEIPLPKTCQSNRGPGGTGWGWCTKHWHLTRQVSEPLVALVVCGHCWSVLWSEGYCRRCEKRELKTWLSSWQTSFCQTPIEKRQCVRSLSPALLTNNEELISLQPSQQTPFGEVWWWGSIGNEQRDSFYSTKTFPVNFGFGIVESV